MTDPSVYDLLAKQIEGGFDRLDSGMNNLTHEVREINGRVTDAHILLASHSAQLEAGTKRIEILAGRSHEHAALLQKLQTSAPVRDRKVTVREVVTVLTTVTLTVGVLKFLGMVP